MLPSKRSHWYIYDFPFWISSVLPSCNHFVCTSFFVDIYIIMIVFYLESWSHERSYISNWYPLFFHVHRCISFFGFGGNVKGFVLSAYLIFLHLGALFGREDYFSSCLSWWGFCHFQLVSLLLTRFLLPIFTMGCHKRWFLFCLLVSLWTHFLVCVCGNDMSCTLYLISSRLCWWAMLILILSLLKCFAMTHTHYFGWAYS